jgi:hypothetical protein
MDQDGKAWCKKMTNISRRNFLDLIASAAAVALAGPSIRAFSGNLPAFEMLVVGDSHISGQGLLLKHKFYQLVKEWLEGEVFGGARPVNMLVKAHSGSRIELHEDEKEKMVAAGDDLYKFHHPEANLSQPSITHQLTVAKNEYGDGSKVDLIMLSGGITDVLVANTVNPFIKIRKLGTLIDRHCRDDMHGLLTQAVDWFPNSKILVIGYFPIISEKSDVDYLLRYLFKTVKFPHQLQFMLQNGGTRLIMKRIRKKMIARSRFWVERSNAGFRDAIARANKTAGSERVIFVESPITESGAFGTKSSMLWATDKDNFPADERYTERKQMCPKVFEELKHDHYGKMSVRMCELAAIGHPNVEGSRAFAEAVKKTLRPLFEDERLAVSRTDKRLAYFDR